jgi:hypothetical protein
VGSSFAISIAVALCAVIPSLVLWCALHSVVSSTSFAVDPLSLLMLPLVVCSSCSARSCRRLPPYPAVFCPPPYPTPPHPQPLGFFPDACALFLLASASSHSSPSACSPSVSSPLSLGTSSPSILQISNPFSLPLLHAVLIPSSRTSRSSFTPSFSYTPHPILPRWTAIRFLVGRSHAGRCSGASVRLLCLLCIDVITQHSCSKLARWACFALCICPALVHAGF